MGHAKADERREGSEAKLMVSFSKLFGSWNYNFGGKYWVMDTDYTSYAVIGDPTRKTGWILARTRCLSVEQLSRWDHHRHMMQIGNSS